MIAISTAYKEALIAIDINGKKVFKSMDANCKHSENLLLNIDKMLDSIKQSLKDNDAISVVIGPGSFTGIRISIALAKGLISGIGQNWNIINLTTFDLMAYSYIKNNVVNQDFYCIINALSGLYYICKYNKLGEKISEEKLIDSEEFSLIKEDKISLQEEDLTDKKVQPSPEELLELSKIKAKETKNLGNVQLLPLYLRKSQAENDLIKSGKK